jgi:hypothetical protein
VATLQTYTSAAARAVADVPSDIAPSQTRRRTAKAKELIIIFVNFVFIKDSAMGAAGFLSKSRHALERGS